MASGPHPCRQVLADLLGELRLPKDEVDRLLAQQIAYANDLVQNHGVNWPTAVSMAGDRVVRDGRVNRAIAKRNAALTLGQVNYMRSFVLRWVNGGGRAKDALQAIMSGFSRDFRGSSRSLESLARHWLKTDMGMLLGGLETAGVMDDFVSGARQTEVMRELSGIDTGDGAAKAIARVITDVRKHQIAALNKRGAYIQEVHDFVATQEHNASRIRELGRRADGTMDPEQSFQAWLQEIQPRIDWQRSFGSVPAPDRQAEILREIHANIITNVDGRSAKDAMGLQAMADRPESLNRYEVARSLAASVSQSRELYFNTTEDWFSYHQRFGTERDLRSLILSEVENRAKRIATMSVLGPNPDLTVQTLIQLLRNELRVSRPANFDWAQAIEDLNPNNQQNFWYNDYVRLTNVNAAVGNEWFQAGANLIKKWFTLTKLPLVAVTSLLDRVNLYRGLVDRGMGNLDAFGRAFWLTAKNLTREEHRLMGNMLESFRGKVIDRYTSMADGSAQGSRVMHWFMSVNGMNALNDNSKSVGYEALASIYGMHTGTAWPDLPSGVRTDLAAGGITPQDWAILRETVTRDYGDSRMLVPGDIMNPGALPDSVIDRVLGPNATANSRRQVRERLYTIYSSMILDQVDRIVVTPGITTQRILSAGAQSGTLAHTVMGLFTLFKSFPVAYVEKFIARPLAGAPVSVATLGQRAAYLAAAAGKSPLVPISHAAMLFAMSYIVMNIKSVIRGQGFIDPTQGGDREKQLKLTADLMLQSGALGILGDVALQQYDTGRQAFAMRMLGPSVELLNAGFALGSQTAGTAIKSLTGQDAEWGQLGNDYLRIIRSNTPGSSYPVIGAALDHLFWNTLADMFEPGTTERRQAKREREGLVKVGAIIE